MSVTKWKTENRKPNWNDNLDFLFGFCCGARGPSLWLLGNFVCVWCCEGLGVDLLLRRFHTLVCTQTIELEVLLFTLCHVNLRSEDNCICTQECLCCAMAVGGGVSSQGGTSCNPGRRVGQPQFRRKRSWPLLGHKNLKVRLVLGVGLTQKRKIFATVFGHSSVWSTSVVVNVVSDLRSASYRVFRNLPPFQNKNWGPESQHKIRSGSRWNTFFFCAHLHFLWVHLGQAQTPSFSFKQWNWVWSLHSGRASLDRPKDATPTVRQTIVGKRLSVEKPFHGASLPMRKAEVNVCSLQKRGSCSVTAAADTRHSNAQHPLRTATPQCAEEHAWTFSGFHD